MKIIGFEDIKSLNISPIDCYKWVSEMIANKDNSLLPQKIHMSRPEGIYCNVMPCFLYRTDGCNMGGCKIVTRYPKRMPSLDSKILLFNADTGEFLSLIDGNWITAMRTGGVTVHSIINFAKRDYKTIGMIGLGNTARATLLILSEIVDKPLNIKLFQYKDQAENFEEKFKKIKNLNFSIVNNIEELIKYSDVIISCATYFENDIASDNCFQEGVLVVPVHTRGFLNCDLFFDKVFADDTGHVEHFKNFSKFKNYAQVSDVICGKAIGRENDKERILIYNIGLSIHDINYATKIYHIFRQNKNQFNKLQEIHLQEPIEKFWV